MEINNALLQRFKPALGGEVWLVRISKVISQLQAVEINPYKTGHSMERAHQLACADQVIASALTSKAKVIRDENGAPSLPSTDHHVSISHTGDYMAIYLHKTDRVAIDIEIMGRDISKIQGRFALEEELNLLKETGSNEALLQLWSIKECLFKVIPVNEVLFKQHLRVIAVERSLKKWKQTCIVDHPKHKKEYSIVSRIFEPLIVSYTVI